MEKQGFVTISDHRYFDGVVALINSIRRFHSDPITVIDEGLTEEQRAKLGAANIDVRKANRSVQLDSDRYGCCYAIFDADAAPYERLICIDPDAILIENVAELFELAQKHPICAVSGNAFRALVEPGYRRKLHHSFPRSKWQFLRKHPRFFSPLRRRFSSLNSGVVVMQREVLPVLRAAAVNFSEFYEDFALPDQDLLALCLADIGVRYHTLDPIFNAVGLHWDSENEALQPVFRRRAVRMDAMIGWEGRLPIVTLGSGQIICPKVVHFAGIDKPWLHDMPLRAGLRELWLAAYNDGVMRAVPAETHIA